MLGFFVLGYAFYAALFAVAGALVPRQEEIQNATTTITVVLLAAYFLGFQAASEPAGGLAQVLSLVPPTAAIVLPVRVIAGGVAVFDHVTIRVTDRAASEAFYDTVLATLGVERTATGDTFTEWDDFSLAAVTAGRPATRRLHIGFAAPSREHVDAFWRAGTAAGYRDDGAPGPRPQYAADYYGAFLLDPDGNSAEAVHHDGVRTNGVIDHLWIRVADVPVAKAFYATIAPHAGLRAGHQTPGLAQFRSEGGSFCLVAGTPTEHLHMAFAADDHAAVEAFHRVATEAGHRDDGAPGERPEYHAGYYGAYVLDPDANSVEVVDHGRP